MILLIVDDEIILREKLQSIIKKSNIAFTEVLIAQDAFQALELFDTYQPDIILSDIKMPLKNGIELAEDILKKKSDTLIILLSGYYDYDYARSAIHLNIFDYLLKPVDESALISTLRKGIDTLKSRLKHKEMHNLFKQSFSENYNTMLQNFTETLLFHYVCENQLDHQKTLFKFDASNFCVIAIKPFNNLADFEIKYYCITQLKHYLSTYDVTPYHYLFGDILYIIWTKPFDEIPDFYQSLSTFIHKNALDSVLVGVSHITSHLSELRHLRKEATLCVEQQFDTDLHSPIFYTDISNRDEASHHLDDVLSELNHGMRNGNKMQLDIVVHKLMSHLTQSPTSIPLAETLLRSNLMLLLQEYKIPDTSRPLALRDTFTLAQINSTDQKLTQLSTIIFDVYRLILESHSQTTSQLINVISAYIEQHFSQPIGLPDLAAHVNRNPSYISRVIKSHTNQTFVQIITTRRIDEAKKLLRDKTLTLDTIATDIGYPNTTYFRRVFKKQVGMSCSDYRNIILD